MIEPFPRRFDLPSCPAEPLRLMASLSEIPQYVRREIEGLVQGQPPGRHLRRELEIGVAETIAERAQVDRTLGVSQRERGEVRQEVRDVVDGFGLAGPIEIDDANPLAVDHDVAVSE